MTIPGGWTGKCPDCQYLPCRCRRRPDQLEGDERLAYSVGSMAGQLTLVAKELQGGCLDADERGGVADMLADLIRGLRAADVTGGVETAAMLLHSRLHPGNGKACNGCRTLVHAVLALTGGPRDATS